MSGQLAGLQLKVGDVVTVGVPCLLNPPGARGLVVEIYDIGDGPSPSVLFANGAHDGFSPRELEAFRVELVGHEAGLAGYQFTSAVQLYQDWRRGLFARVWLAARGAA